MIMATELRIIIAMSQYPQTHYLEHNNYPSVARGRVAGAGEERQLLVSSPKALGQYSPVLQGIKKTQASSLIGFQPCRRTSS